MEMKKENKQLNNSSKDKYRRKIERETNGATRVENQIKAGDGKVGSRKNRIFARSPSP